MSDLTGNSRRDLIGDEPFVFTFAGDEADAAADKCFDALVGRFGEEAARKALRATLKRRRLTKGKVTNLMMDALHEVLKDEGARDPTAQVEKVFGGDGPLGSGQKRGSVRRRLRRVQASKRPMSED